MSTPRPAPSRPRRILILAPLLLYCAVDLFVRRLLAKDPNERPADALEVVSRIEDLREQLYPEWRPDLEDSEGVALPVDID